ncbi:MAG: radical SAM protein [bacterium]|nr:MAG: radical SAM protein [bacterium]
MRGSKNTERNDKGVGALFYASLFRWGTRGVRRFPFLIKAGWRIWSASRRRRRAMRILGIPVPYVVALSPTMSCNYNCMGCYARGRGGEGELTVVELERLIEEAEKLGVFAILFTGGEPLLRTELLDIMKRHRRLFFVFITNGSLVTPEIAGRFASLGHIMVLVSVEGRVEDTEACRGPGSHERALRALGLLREHGAFFGFAVTVRRSNARFVTSEGFVDEMVALGCSVGYFTEYVPCGDDPVDEWVIDSGLRDELRRRVLGLRRTKPIILVQFPHDEYGEENICTAAGRYSLHISSHGEIEPCPFVPVSCENIREGGLITALRSPFLEAIRRRPELLRRSRYACALHEHRSDLEAMAAGIRGIRKGAS